MFQNTCGVFGGVRDRQDTCDVKQTNKTGGGRENRYCRVTEKEKEKEEGPED